ncbi:MAG: CHAD domain-containing protein [Proteobacteria bacterium]|nr:CHAD domain-containing protein [Pseudomonadota bacterium]
MEEPRVAIVRSYRPVAGVPDARAVMARRVPLRRAMTVEQAFRATMLECLAQVAGNAPAIRARDPKGVHQIRVGLRRLQMALKSFGDYGANPRLKALGRRGRVIADAFGPARDLDVFAEEMFAPVMHAYSDHESFLALAQALRHARGEAWDDALSEVLNPDFAAFLNEIAAAAESMPHDDTKIGKVSDKALTVHWTKAKKRGRKTGKAFDARAHRLRVALKKLRYTAEFFAPLYPGKRTQRYIKALKTLLDRFGEANDVQGIEKVLARLGDGPELRYAAGIVAGWHGAREAALGKAALADWRKFRKLKPFWD